MSLINQMLQDLESRRAVGEQVSLPNYVRPLPLDRPSIAPKILAAGIVLSLAFAGSVFWWFQIKPGTTQPAHSLPALLEGKSAPPVAKLQTPLAVQVAPPAVLPPTPAVNEHPVADSSESRSVDWSENNTPVSDAQPAKAPLHAVAGRQQSNYELKIAKALLQLPRTNEQELQSINTTPSVPLVTEKKADAGPVVIEKQVRLATANERAENEYRKALTVLNQGRINEAIASLRDALKEDGTHPNARQALAAILVEQKRLEEAQVVLQEGLVQNPAQPVAAIKLARIQVERGDIKAAEETLQRSAASGAENADYRAFHAGVLQRLGEHRASINEYQAALRLAPQSNVWWMGLGISLDAEGKTTEARDAFLRARTGRGLSADLDRFVEQKLRQLQ